MTFGIGFLVEAYLSSNHLPHACRKDTPDQENLRSRSPGLRLRRPHAHRLIHYRPARRRPHPASSGERALQDSGSLRAAPSACSLPPHSAVKPGSAIPHARPASRTVEVYPPHGQLAQGNAPLGAGSASPGYLPCKYPSQPGDALPAPSLPADVPPGSLPFFLAIPDRNAYKVK